MWYNFRKKIPRDPYFLEAADLYGLAVMCIVPPGVPLAWWLNPTPPDCLLVTAKKRTGLEPGDANIIGKRTVDGSGLALPAAIYHQNKNNNKKIVQNNYV